MGMKEAYQEKADAQLREWWGWIEEYKSNPIQAGLKHREVQQRWNERLDDCHRIATSRLAELRASREERWELAKQAVERAMIELKKVLDESGAGSAGKILQLQSSRSYMYDPFHRKG